MNCKEIQEIILTDYLDGELDTPQENAIKKHLSICSDCHEFEMTARQTVVTPFAQADRISPSPEVWEGIKEVMETSEQKQGAGIMEVLEALKSFFQRPRPVFVLSTLAVAMIVLGVVLWSPLNQQRTAPIALKESSEAAIEYLTWLDRDDETINEEVDYGTEIEKYFL